MVERETPRGGAAVDAAPTVTCKERPTRNLSLHDPWNANIGEQPNHVRPWVRSCCSTKWPFECFDDLSFAFDQ